MNWIGRAGQSERKPAWESADAPKEFRELSSRDSVFSAPFIPGRAAQRMVEVGIEQLRDLLQNSPVTLTERMQLDGVTPQILIRWQSQAALMVTVEGLRDQAAMWLTAAGYTSAESIALTQRTSIHRAVQKVIANPEGSGLQGNRVKPRLYIRSSEIDRWIALASAQVEFSQRKSA